MEVQRRRSEDGDVVFKEGRDEMNLIEFPLAAIAERLPPETKQLVFESTAGDGTIRRLTISGSSAFGLPTAKDDEVLVALMQLAKLQGFRSEKVAFSRYQILQVLGWPISGQSYERVDLAVNRWVGVTYYWENSWWDKAAESWVDEKFGILDNAEMYDREKWSKRAKSGQVPLPLSWVKWNEVVYRSFCSGYIKYLDMDVYRALKLPLAKRLYRYLDKHFYRKGTLRFDIQRLAREKLGLLGEYDNANLKRILYPAIQELENTWDLDKVSREERFSSPRRGVCEVVFVKRRGAAESGRDPLPEPSALERELLSRGVGAKVAAELVALKPEAEIREKVELHDWLVMKRDPRIAKNPAGFLTSAIRDNYPLPKGFETTAQRTAKEAAKTAGELTKRNEAQARRIKLEDERQCREAARLLVAQHLQGLSTEEAATLEAKAVARAPDELRRYYEQSKRMGVGKIFEEARTEILFAWLSGEGTGRGADPSTH